MRTATTVTRKDGAVAAMTDPGSDHRDGCTSAAHPCQSEVAERGATWQLTDRSPPVGRQLEPPGNIENQVSVNMYVRVCVGVSE